LGVDAKEAASLGEAEMDETKTPLPSAVPEHVEGTMRSIEQLYAEHRVRASPQQRAVRRIIDVISRPSFVFIVMSSVVAWVGLNWLALGSGHAPIDAPPFPWLQGVATLISLLLVVLILGVQKHEDEVNEHREMLSLELAILSEQKTAKIIRMLEEFRRDHPQMLDRIDQEAEVMARPADPQSVLDAIKDTRKPDATPRE
jgi:uncharacterized membrane protein